MLFIFGKHNLGILGGMGSDPLKSALDGLWDWGWGGQRGVGSQNLVSIGIGNILDGHGLTLGRGPSLRTFHNPLVTIQVTSLFNIHRVIQFQGILEAINVHFGIVAENTGIFVGVGQSQQAGESNLWDIKRANQILYPLEFRLFLSHLRRTSCCL